MPDFDVEEWKKTLDFHKAQEKYWFEACDAAEAKVKRLQEENERLQSENEMFQIGVKGLADEQTEFVRQLREKTEECDSLDAENDWILLKVSRCVDKMICYAESQEALADADKSEAHRNTHVGSEMAYRHCAAMLGEVLGHTKEETP